MVFEAPFECHQGYIYTYNLLDVIDNNGCEEVYREQCIVVYSIAIVVFSARFEPISRGKWIIFSFKPNRPLQIN